MKRIGRLFDWLLLSCLMAAVITLVLPRLFGLSLFVVRSASMEPAYSVGDLLYVVPTEFQDIRIGDAISYTVNETGTVVTHRVIEKDEGLRSFRTKGDANNTIDGAFVAQKNVIGVVRASIPQMGRLAAGLNTWQGKLIGICLVCGRFLFGILLLPKKCVERREGRDRV